MGSEDDGKSAAAAALPAPSPRPCPRKIALPDRSPPLPPIPPDDAGKLQRDSECAGEGAEEEEARKPVVISEAGATGIDGASPTRLENRRRQPDPTRCSSERRCSTGTRLRAEADSVDGVADDDGSGAVLKEEPRGAISRWACALGTSVKDAATPLAATEIVDEL